MKSYATVAAFCILLSFSASLNETFAQEKDKVLQKAKQLLRNYKLPDPETSPPTETPEQSWDRYYQEKRTSISLTKPQVVGNGLYGYYFNNTTLTGLPTLVRTDTTINFNWGSGSPGPGIGTDYFSVRWLGEVEPEFSQEYTFYSAMDDGVRLWIGNALVIDHWQPNSGAEYSGNISLTAGGRYPIRVEYFENAGSASAKVSWSSPSRSKEVIPKARLFATYQLLQINTMPSNGVSTTYGNTVVGDSITVWGNAAGGNWVFRYRLEYGDGTIDSGSVANPHFIGRRHVYTTAGRKTMTLTVWDSTGISGSDQSQIEVSPFSTDQVRVNMAIEKGLLFLYRKQYPDGSWYDNKGSTASTGMSLLVFEENGHLHTNDFSIDIYAEYVDLGLNHLFANARTMTIFPQPAGNPDTDGDNTGVYFTYTGNSGPYADGMGLLAVLAAHKSGTNAQLDTIQRGPYRGKSYYDFMVDALDQLSFSQTDTTYGNKRGGWRYCVDCATYTGDGSNNSDNSATQWPSLVIEAAQSVWAITVPQFVKDELLRWLRTTQISAGGFLYGNSAAPTWHNITKTGSGIGSYAALGYASSFDSVQHALTYLATHWYDLYDIHGDREQFNGSLYAMFAMAKALRIINGRSGLDSVGSHRWYDDYVNHLLNHPTWGQKQNGSWIDGSWLAPSYVGDTSLATAFGIAVLTQGVVIAPPVAVIAPISPKPPNTSFQVDGSGSYHQDPTKAIVEYLWDWDASNGVDWDHPDVTGPRPTNPGYPMTGTYTITLRVKDNGDPPLYDTETRSVVIRTGNTPPVAVAIPPNRGPSYAGKVGEPILLDGRGSYDPDYPLDSIAHYSWDTNGDLHFGDALTDTVTVLYNSEYNGVVGLKVTDTRSDSSRDSAYIRIVSSRKDMFVVRFDVTLLGGTMDLKALFRNDPSSDVDVSEVLVRFYDGDPLTTGTKVGSDFHVNLPRGATDSIETTIAAPSLLGHPEHDIYVYLDANDQVAEWNEQNNFAKFVLLPHYGTTVITHGLTDNGTGIDDAPWTLTMASAIAERMGNAKVYTVDRGVINTRPEFSSGNGQIGEKIIVFDWVEESDRNLFGYAEGAADALAGLLIEGVQAGNWSLGQLHFIGHSRGSIVLSETIERLGLYAQAAGMLPPGIVVDPNIHLTPLDAHPWTRGFLSEPYSADDDFVNSNTNDLGVVCWENVRYADNYWHHSLFPSDLNGLSTIPGANYNKNLTATILDYVGMSHQGVHAWYYGTINTSPTVHDDGAGTEIGDSWYPNNERYQRGYNNIAAFRTDLGDYVTSSERRRISEDHTLTKYGIFNGDFSKNGLFKRYIFPHGFPPDLSWDFGLPGWEMQGGGGTAIVSDGRDNSHNYRDKKKPIDNAFLILDADHLTRSHNYLYIPTSATELHFRAHLHKPSDDDALKVFVGNSLAAEFPLSRNRNPGYYPRKSVDLTQFLGTTQTLKFSLAPGGSTVESEVWIDDVAFEKRRYIVASVASPVDLHAYDSFGNHIGPTSDSTWEISIPGSGYYVESDTLPEPRKTIVLPPPEPGVVYTYRIQSRDTSGSFAFAIEDVTGDRFTLLATFDSVGVWPNTAAVCSLRTVTKDLVLKVDQDGNGDYETTIHPTQFDGVTNALSIQSGWNLVSVPSSVVDRRKISLFPSGRSKAFKFTTKYEEEDTLATGSGYWLKFDSAQAVEISGLPITAETIKVNRGWNMIGSISDSIPVGAIRTIPDGLTSSSFFGYDAAYYVSNFIGPGNGYWIKTNDSGKIILASSGASLQMRQSILSPDSSGKFSILTIGNSRGVTERLRFGQQPGKNFLLSYFELPPIPPAGSFDARFISNRMLEVIEEGKTQEFPLLISSAEYPVTISWELKSQDVTALLIIDDKEVSMKSNGSTQIAHPTSHIALRLTGAANLPKEFALEQNYPNPFNPLTVIRYQLPVQSHVTLRIYNLLGQEVKTLVNEIRDAGYESVEWNSTNNYGNALASGMYFYKLEATSVNDLNKTFTKVRKMLLVR